MAHWQAPVYEPLRLCWVRQRRWLVPVLLVRSQQCWAAGQVRWVQLQRGQVRLGRRGWARGMAQVQVRARVRVRVRVRVRARARARVLVLVLVLVLAAQRVAGWVLALAGLSALA